MSRIRKPMSTEAYRQKSERKYGEGTFIYDRLNYTGPKCYVEIGCPVHGYFIQSASDHSKGKGCRNCQDPEAVFDTQSFIRKGKSVHGDKFDYSDAVYTGYNSKITIVCPQHGAFTPTPANHLRGHGCPVCRYVTSTNKRRKTLSTFVAEALQVHFPVVYDYSEVEYITGKTKVKIKCPVHGPFMQQPCLHLTLKNGCPSCASTGFSKDKPGNFYILVCGNITKVGITNRAVKVRASHVSRDSGLKFDVLRAYNFTDGAICCELESIILQALRAEYKKVDMHFDGHTECFVGVNRDELIRLIEITVDKINNVVYNLKS